MRALRGLLFPQPAFLPNPLPAAKPSRTTAPLPRGLLRLGPVRLAALRGSQGSTRPPRSPRSAKSETSQVSTLESQPRESGSLWHVSPREDCTAIAKAIGLPPDTAAGQTLVAACDEAMGIVPEPGATLPGRKSPTGSCMADIGCVEGKGLN